LRIPFANTITLFFLTGFIPGHNVEDAIGIEFVADLHLRHSTRSRRDSIQIKSSQKVVVLGSVSLSFVNIDFDAGLVIGFRGKHFHLLARDGGVTADNLGHDASDGLQAEGKRSNIEEEEILNGITAISVQDSGLDGSSVSDGLIGVDGAARLLGRVFLAVSTFFFFSPFF
jgi:hypothetical protein